MAQLNQVQSKHLRFLFLFDSLSIPKGDPNRCQGVRHERGMNNVRSTHDPLQSKMLLNCIFWIKERLKNVNGACC